MTHIHPSHKFGPGDHVCQRCRCPIGHPLVACLCVPHSTGDRPCDTEPTAAPIEWLDINREFSAR
jgi:hypothetical protein